MKVLVTKREDGLVDVLVEPPRGWPVPPRAVLGVKPEDAGDVGQVLAAEIRSDHMNRLGAHPE